MRCSEQFHSCGHLGRIIDLRERVTPRSIDPQVLFDIFDQVPDAFAGVVARTVIVDIPKGPFNRIGSGTVGR